MSQQEKPKPETDLKELENPGDFKAFADNLVEKVAKKLSLPPEAYMDERGNHDDNLSGSERH